MQELARLAKSTATTTTRTRNRRTRTPNYSLPRSTCKSSRRLTRSATAKRDFTKKGTKFFEAEEAAGADDDDDEDDDDDDEAAADAKPKRKPYTVKQQLLEEGSDGSP